MQREILFRGKSEKTGEWLYGDLLQNHYKDIDCYWIIPKDRKILDLDNALQEGSLDVIPETVGQYIGWEDESGEKIFEGDIVTNVRGSKFPIMWNDGMDADNSSISPGIKTFGWIGDQLIIIGNRFDNPELLQPTT